MHVVLVIHVRNKHFILEGEVTEVGACRLIILLHTV